MAPRAPLSADADSLYRASERSAWIYDSGWREPLFPFLARLVAATGVADGVAAVRLAGIATTIAGFGALLWLLARDHGALPAVLAGAAWMANPYVAHYGVSGERVVLASLLVLFHWRALFRTAPSTSRTLLVIALGAALPLLRTEALALVVGAGLASAWIRRRDGWRRELALLGISLALFAPYPAANLAESGTPFPGAALHARSWANHEFAGRPGGQHATLAEVHASEYAGGPLAPSEYILGMHETTEVVRRYAEGYLLLVTRYLPRYAVVHGAVAAVALVGLLLELRRRRWEGLLVLVLAHLPFAFIYPLDQVAPGSGVEARYAMGTTPLLAYWSAGAVAWVRGRFAGASATRGDGTSGEPSAYP